MRFGLFEALRRGVRRYVIFSELNFVVPTLVKKSGPAIYGHCDVLQGTEGAPQRPQISRSVVKKSLHDMIGELFALENEPTLSLFNCQMPDFAHAAVFNSYDRPNESLINLHWSILTASRTSVAS